MLPSQAKPSQAKPSQAKPSQAKPSQATQWLARSKFIPDIFLDDVGSILRTQLLSAENTPMFALTPFAPMSVVLRLMALIATLVYTNLAYAALPAAPATGLTAYFAFEDDVLDSSGNHNGTLVGGASYAPGVQGNALNMDSLSRYVSVPGINVGSAFTYTGWYLPSWDVAQPNSSTRWQTFFHSNSYCGSGNAFGMMYDRIAAILRLYVGNNCTGVRDIAALIPSGTWFHFAITYDGTNINTYINGVSKDRFAWPGAIANSSPFVIGANLHPLTYNWQGRIDEVRIYGRALGSDEVAGMVAPAGSTFALDVSGSGAGTGTVTSGETPPHINCTSAAGVKSGTCSSSEAANAVLTLTATPAAGSTFTGWTGCDNSQTADTPPKCVVTMTVAKNVAAIFGSSSPTVKAVFPTSDTELSEIMQGGQVLRWYALESSTGTPLANQNVNYQIFGEEKKSSLTNESGLFWIETDPQIELTGNTSRLMSVTFVGLGVQTFMLKVAARAIEQNWLSEANIKGEVGIGPQIGVEAKIAGIGAMAKAGLKTSMGFGGTFSLNSVYKANLAGGNYVFSTTPDDPLNRTFSFSEAWSEKLSVGTSGEASLGLRVAPNKLVGAQVSVGVEIVGALLTANTYTFPLFFDTTSPVGPCHFGWRLTEGIAPGIGSSVFLGLNQAPSSWLCGTPLINYQTENKRSMAIAVNAKAGARVGLNGLTVIGSGGQTDSRISKLAFTEAVDGGLLLTEEVADKYKDAVLDGREEKIEIVFSGKAKGSIGASMSQYYGHLGKTWAGKLELGASVASERKWSKTEVYDSTGNLSRMKWQGSLANAVAGNVAVGKLSNWTATDMLEDRLSVETTNVADAVGLQGVALHDLIEFSSNDVETALESVMSLAPGAPYGVMKYALNQERRLTPVEIAFDLGAALGVNLKVGAGIKAAVSDRYLKSRGMISTVTLDGQPRRLMFATEHYDETDQYLGAQAKSPTVVIEQMALVAGRFTNKLLATAAQIVANVVDDVKTAVQVTADAVSDLTVRGLEAGEKVVLTIEKWAGGLFSEGQTSALYIAMASATADPETVVGPVHFVNVLTTAGVERDALPQTAALTIGKVSQYVVEAGLPATAANQVRLYRIDTDTHGKSFVGGTYSNSTDQLVISLTQTGAYVMIVDTKAPSLEVGLATVLDATTGALKVSTVINQDVSGIDPTKLSLRLNGLEMLKSSKWQDYFNPLTNSFEFVVPRDELLPGTNQIEFKVLDRAGNQLDVSSQTSVPTTTRLINLSTRGQVQTGDNVMIGGFIIGGSTPKKVLVRAVGPNLANYGVTGVLADPMLDLNSGGSVIASNDDWGSAANAAEIQASTFAPVNSKEAAILSTLNPGAYTAIVSGKGGGTGVGIVEVYELDHPEIPLINISTRGKVLTGDNVMIGGFIIQGDAPKTVLIRAVGPNLANYGVAGVLANPKLDLYSGGTIIASNDDWGTAANAAAVTATGLAPVSPLESAILISLPPGAYTAIVSGADGGTGVGIVEVFAQ